MDTTPTATFFTSQLHHTPYEFIQKLTGDVSGRSVLVTGSTKGIGQAMVVSYARAGYSKIALLARSSMATTIEKATAAAKEAGHKVPQFLELHADLASVKEVNVAANTVKSTFGGTLDVLVNCAGYLEEWKSVADSDPDEWWRSWEVNLKGTYLMDRAFIPQLLAGETKQLVTVTSAGAWVQHPGASAYQGSKTAQIRLTSHIMAEYAEQGLLAYSLHPGAVKTDLAHGMPAYMHSMLVDEPELAGDTVVWLTQERRPWLADRYLSASWDMEEILAKKDMIIDKGLLKLHLTR